MKRLYRSLDDKKVAGVCGGLGEYFGIDPVFLRIFFVLITLFPPGSGILIYLIMWLVVPRKQ
jgi:phage shock protein C